MGNRDKMRLLRQEAEAKAQNSLEALDKRVKKLEKGKAKAAEQTAKAKAAEEVGAEVEDGEAKNAEATETAESTENSAKKGKK